MKQIVFATNNSHKLNEVRSILAPAVSVLSLEDINCREDIPETADTLEENALMKARYIKTHYGYDCFSDDTGLEVNALNNRPGVFSARYAGDGKSSEDNMNKLLDELKDKTDRLARFRTVVALIVGEKEYLFEGAVNGIIVHEKRGNAGFGYDPLFVPDGYTESFAELGDEIKNRISHRAKAILKFKKKFDENQFN